MGKDKRIVVLSDMQIPYHDKELVNKVINFVHDYQPDVLACVGDEADSPEPSRWTKGLAGEYAGTLQKGLDETHNVLSLFRAAVGDVPFIIHRSNHGDRIRNYIDKYAPALGSLRDLEYESLLGFDQLGIKQTRQPYPIAPGWLMVHGDEGGSSRIAGGTAMALARKFGKSVVAGHTHKQAVIHEHTSYSGATNQYRFGFEVGHMMDMRQADYLKAGDANWQSGFGLLTVSNGKTFATPVPSLKGSFTVDGVTY